MGRDLDLGVLLGCMWAYIIELSWEQTQKPLVKPLVFTGLAVSSERVARDLCQARIGAYSIYDN